MSSKKVLAVIFYLLIKPPITEFSRRFYKDEY